MSDGMRLASVALAALFAGLLVALDYPGASVRPVFCLAFFAVFFALAAVAPWRWERR